MKQPYTIILTIILMLLMTGISMAAKVPAPTDPPEGVKIISINEANEILNQKNVYIFDLRKEFSYGKGHIPGAVSFPYKWARKDADFKPDGDIDLSKLPVDKNTAIIFHCDGPEEWKSYYTSKAAKKAGYTNVMWLREGYSAWANKGYAVEH